MDDNIPDEYLRNYRDLQLWAEPFEHLDSALLETLEIHETSSPALTHVRQASGPSKVIYRCYLKIVDPASIRYGDQRYLGEIELRMMQRDVTQVVIQRIVTGKYSAQFENIVEDWKRHIEFDKVVSDEVRKRGSGDNAVPGAASSCDDFGTKPPRRPPGRPRYADDIWAWEQVNLSGRAPAAVYAEWQDREGVRKRDLHDPQRHFRKISRPEWGTKPGQNV